MRHIHRLIAITDKSSVGEARRAAVATAHNLGFDEGRRSDIGIAATEAATNILMHARTGEILICPFAEGESVWLDVIALDSGPGIREVIRAMEDGFSTIGTPGQGLGAIDRLADEASLYSVQEKGTAYWIRFRHGEAPPHASVGLVNLPLAGESSCGDSYLILPGVSRSLYMMVDGLGHGTGAAEAAQEAIATVNAASDEPVGEILARTHNALKKTRGAAMSLALIDRDRSTLTYSGIGNISAMITGAGTSRSLISQNGTLGAVVPRTIQEYTYPIQGNSILTMFSDGLSSKASLTGYQGIHNRHAALLAGLLYRDFSRKRDDATVMVAPIGALPV